MNKQVRKVRRAHCYTTWCTRYLLTLLFYVGPVAPLMAGETIRVGSKAFTESHILAELAAQLLESEGYQVERKLGLGEP